MGTGIQSKTAFTLLSGGCEFKSGGGGGLAKTKLGRKYLQMIRPHIATQNAPICPGEKNSSSPQTSPV